MSDIREAEVSGHGVSGGSGEFRFNIPSRDELLDALDSMILSASGWRKVFAPGGEQDKSRIPHDADCLIAFVMGLVWGDWFLESAGGDQCRILAGMDTRPTGPVLAELIMRGLESAGADVTLAGVTASPEIMARSRMCSDLAGFVYISASHNPVGHNGVKVGRDGGVVDSGISKIVIPRFPELIKKLDVTEVFGKYPSLNKGFITLREHDNKEKAQCLKDYKDFLIDIANDPPVLEPLQNSLKKQPVGIVADMNGSARSLSSDHDFLSELGAKLYSFNDKPGDIAHEILPEGSALIPCLERLGEIHRENESVMLGYVPDNDGDRGNLVIWDETCQAARILEAQEVFALCAVAELAILSWGVRGINHTDTRAGSSPIQDALVVNGPTSHRIRDIAALYNARVFEAEVGEANIVIRAKQIRKKGYRVRFLGEGSNGGSIVHPASVRDPLNTIAALLKIIRLPALHGALSPSEDFLSRVAGVAQTIQTKTDPSEQEYSGNTPPGPGAILSALPQFTTTPTSSPRAQVKIMTKNPVALKPPWEKIFQQQWSLHKSQLKKDYGFSSWYQVNNKGTESRIGTGPEFHSHNGGLKVVFTDENNRDMGFLWMRASGTEPVFRIMSEIRGENPEAEIALTAWHSAMVMAADRLASHQSNSLPEIPPPVSGLQ